MAEQDLNSKPTKAQASVPDLSTPKTKNVTKTGLASKGQKSVKAYSDNENTISEMQTPIVPNSTLSEKGKTEVQEKKSKPKQRLKSSSMTMDDLESINEQNLKKYRSRTTRNKFAIATLIILLLAAITTIIILINIRKLNNNCSVYVHGCDAEFVIDGEKLEQFRTPVGIQGNRVYMLDTDVEIHSSGEFNVRFTIEIYQSGTKIKNVFAYDLNNQIFKSGTNEGEYVSKSSVTGGQTIDLFEGIVLDDAYENTLNSENCQIEINIYFERV